MKLELVPHDTTPEAFRVQMEIYRRMPSIRKLELALQMSDTLRNVVAAGVRHQHPDYDDEQVRLAVIRLTLGEELFRKAYPDAQVKG